MSIETQVDQMWGNSKDEEWKAAEVARIKALRGIEELQNRLSAEGCGISCPLRLWWYDVAADRPVV